jgi:CTP-dependent riboflavin kinase
VTARRLRGVIFSDLGQARAFMALEWVKNALEEKLGFPPYPGTLNLRLEGAQDKALWQDLLKTTKGIAVPPPSATFCSARLYPIEIESGLAPARAPLHAAVVVPGVDGYPEDKMEIVAPVQIKDALGVQDGDSLIVEFCAV